VESSGGEGAGLRLVLVFGVHYAARASHARAWYNRGVTEELTGLSFSPLHLH
jgi:hypothetical protein